MKTTAIKIFELITSTSEKLANEYLPDYSCDEIIEKFGEDGYTDAYYFEYTCLIYNHVAKILYVNKPTDCFEIISELLILLNDLFNERFQHLKRDNSLLDILNSRTIQYDTNGDLERLGLNIKKREYVFLGRYTPMNTNEPLLDNSQLFYFWIKNPLSKETPLAFDLSEGELCDYELFLDYYINQMVPFAKEFKDIVKD